VEIVILKAEDQFFVLVSKNSVVTFDTKEEGIEFFEETFDRSWLERCKVSISTVSDLDEVRATLVEPRPQLYKVGGQYGIKCGSLGEEYWNSGKKVNSLIGNA